MAVIGGGSALAAALTHIGAPKDSVIWHEAAVKANNVLLLASGTAAEIEQARAILVGKTDGQVQAHTARDGERSWPRPMPRGRSVWVVLTRLGPARWRVGPGKLFAAKQSIIRAKRSTMKRMAMVSVVFVLTSVVTVSVLAAPHKSDKKQAVVRLTKITCKDFLVLDDGARLKFLYWVEGFSQKGPEDEVVFDFAQTERLVSAVTKDCNQEPNELLWKNVKAEWNRERRSTPAVTIESSGGAH